MAKETAFNIRKQLLQDRIEQVKNNLLIDDDTSFMRVVYAIIFNTNYDDPQYEEDVVDGAGDKQIDIINIRMIDSFIDVTVLQVKNSENYKETIMLQLKDGLQWMFEKDIKHLNSISNDILRDKILEIRELSKIHGLKKFNLKIYYVGKGDTNKISQGFNKEIEDILNSYQNPRIFNSIECKALGANELIEKSEEFEEYTNKIDIDLPIYYDTNKRSFSQYDSTNVSSVICTVKGEDIANMIINHESRIFDDNVRTYLGLKKIVNNKIMETCTDDKNAENFWFLNNGITITCNRFDISNIGNPAIIKIYDAQIVNGCQTSMTLAEALRKGQLSDKTMVLVKIFSSNDSSFIEKITIATNSQSVVTSRDLHSNDMIQRDIEKALESRGYYYERKARKFKNLSKDQQNRVISNEKMAQSHLAIVQHQPVIAMAQSSKIWDIYYESTFRSNINELISSYLIYKNVIELQKKNKIKEISDDRTRLISSIEKYGSFHLSCIIGYLFTGNDWKSSNYNLSNLIIDLENKNTDIEDKYIKAKNILLEIIESIYSNQSSLINIFKSQDIQRKIDEKFIDLSTQS